MIGAAKSSACKSSCACSSCAAKGHAAATPAAPSHTPSRPSSSLTSVPASMGSATGARAAAERQADRAADGFMRGAVASPVSTGTATGRSSLSHPTSNATASRRMRSAVGTGTALPKSVRAPYEQYFQADFSNVTIHTGRRASMLTGILGRDAVASGEAIALGGSGAALGTASGRRLLAHEYAHVVQQRGGGSRGLTAAAPGIYGGIAGNCWNPHMTNGVIGTRIHRMIQAEMQVLYPTMMAEVLIPGGGAGTNGLVDLYLSQPSFIVPAPGSAAAIPPPAGSFPPFLPPDVALLGSIKPLTTNIDAHADLMTYITAYDVLAVAAGGFANGARMSLPIPPTWLNPGVFFPLSPVWAPQMLHVFTPGDGVYWYFCRPMGELGPALYFLYEGAREIARRLESMMRQIGEWLAPLGEGLAAAFAALMQALSDFGSWIVENWQDILLGIGIAVLAVVAVVLAVKLGILAAIGTALAGIATAIAGLFTEGGMVTAVATLAVAAVSLFSSSEASAATSDQGSGGQRGQGQGGHDIQGEQQQQQGSGGQQQPGGQEGSQNGSGLNPAQGAREMVERALELLNEATSQTNDRATFRDMVSRLLIIVEEAELRVSLSPNGEMLAIILRGIRHLLQAILDELADQSAQASGANGRGRGQPPQGGGQSQPSPQGGQGQTPPPPPSGGQGQTPPPPAGGHGQTPPPPTGGQGQTPPPSVGGQGQAPPGGTGGRQGDQDLSGHASGSGPASWPVIFEEIDRPQNIVQIYPLRRVDPAESYSILRSQNSEAILETRPDGDGGHLLVNLTTGRVVGRVVRSTRNHSTWELVSGELYDRMQSEIRDWASRDNRARGYDFPVRIHFK